MKIKLIQPEGDLYGTQIIELLKVIDIINQSPDNEIILDFSNISFVRPLFILSLSGLIHKLRKEGKTVFMENFKNSYFELIRFEKGLSPDNFENWEEELLNFQDKSYFPIINFPTFKDAISVKLRNDSLTCINRLIKNSLMLDSNTYNAISYLISEMTDNISDHSGEERGWLFAQYYSDKKFIDICILDTGKTILGSYQNNGFKEIKTSTQALECATKGLSTKNIERGKGIPTTRKLIVNGMTGKFGLVSGNAILQNDQITELPTTWPGTFLALRIPQKPPNFDFYQFVE
jgi:anti-sigma regulatory factor (Ser/Thr protein kinase)